MPGELEAIEGSTTPAGGSPPVAPATQPAAGTSAAAVPPAQLPLPKTKSKDEDDEESVKPDDKGIIRMPFKSFLSRVRKATKADLKAMFGTDDKEALMKWKRDYDAHLVTEEEKRRADLSEKERLADDAKTANQRATEAERRAEKVRDKYVMRKVDSIVTRSAEKYVQAKYIPAAVALLKEAKLRAVRKGEDFTTKHLGEWFARYARKNPELAAKAAGAAPPKEEKKKKEALSNGVGPDGSKPPKPVVTDGAGLVNGKTARPGQPNSMNKAELRAFQRSQGLNGM